MDEEPLITLLGQCIVRLLSTNSSGAGFFIAPGYILTCAHVVESVPDGQLVSVYWEGRAYSAQLQRFFAAPYPDLALLRLKEQVEHPCVYLDDKAIRGADPLYSYGFPAGYPEGSPSRFTYEGQAKGKTPLLTFKGGEVREGFSGSPILNLRTNAVCGMIRLTRGEDTLMGGRGIPASTILAHLSDIADTQRTFHEQDQRWKEAASVQPRSSSTKLQKPRITRRQIILFSLAGVGVTVTGISWQELTHHSFTPKPPASSPTSTGTTAPTSPSPTDVPQTGPGQMDVTCVAWSPDGTMIASGSNDSTVLVRNVITGHTILRQPQPTHIQSVAWSPDGTKIASGNQDGSVQIWDATTGYVIAHAGGTSSPQETSLSWSPDGKKIATTGAQVWDATSGKPLLTYQNTETNSPVAWSPDGTSIASGGVAAVYVWNAANGQFITQYNGGSMGSLLNTVVWSPDGKFIAASYVLGNLVNVWNTTTGQLTTSYGDDNQPVSGNVVAWSPDGKKMASLSPEGIQIWDPATGKPLSTITLKDTATCIAWSPNSKKIASGSLSNTTVQLWSV